MTEPVTLETLAEQCRMILDELAALRCEMRATMTASRRIADGLSAQLDALRTVLEQLK
jgi:hypothetical protein